MVTCTRQVVSGGSLGQSPDTVISEGYPRTAATKMQDGSQVLVRIPNMCRRYRAYELKPGYSGVSFMRGWRTRGPHAVIPLVIWSDSAANPQRIESYIARAYYEQPQARIKNPRGTLDLWPVGKYPDNAAQILKALEPLPYYPHPNINPTLDPNGRGKGRDGNYHGNGSRFVMSAIVPLSDPVAAWEKNGEVANRRIAEAARRSGPAIQRAIYFEDENFVVRQGDPYNDILGNYGPDPSYIYAECLGRSITGLMLGDPGMSDFPYDPEDWHNAWPVDVRTPGAGFHTPQNIALLDRREMSKRNCYAQLDKLRSFEIVDGRFDASRALPGMLAYGRWGFDPFPASHWNSGTYRTLKEMGLEEGGRIMFRINGHNLSLNPLYSYVVKEKWSGEWYYVKSLNPGFYGGEGEGSGVG